MKEYSNEVFTNVSSWETEITSIQTQRTVKIIQPLQIYFNFQNTKIIKNWGIPEKKMGLSDCCSKSSTKEKVIWNH